MLSEKKFKVGDFVIIKLINGDELIATFFGQDNGSISLKSIYRLEIRTLAKTGNSTVNFFPYIKATDMNELLRCNVNQVFTVTLANDFFKEKYSEVLKKKK